MEAMSTSQDDDLLMEEAGVELVCEVCIVLLKKIDGS